MQMSAEADAAGARLLKEPEGIMARPILVPSQEINGENGGPPEEEPIDQEEEDRENSRRYRRTVRQLQPQS